MWISTMKDGDVLMGIYGKTVSSIEKIFDTKGGLQPGKNFELKKYQITDE